MRGSAALRAAIAPGGGLAGQWVKDALWRRAKATPSLDFRFGDRKSLVDAVTGQSLVTFTRASSATYVDSTGTIQRAVTNLITYSQTLNNAAWTLSGTGATLTAATDIAAPDGSITAWTLASGSAGTAQIQSTITGISGGTYTGSFWIRRRSGTTGIVYIRVADNVNTQLTGVTSSWQRFSFTATSSSTTIRLGINLAANTESIDLWGAQLEQASTAGDYVPTTSTINSAPRFDHAVTASTTNLCLQSAAISTSPWGPNGIETCVASTLADPTGGFNAFKINFTGSAAFERWQQAITTVVGNTYTLSAWVRSTTGTTQFRLRFGGGVTSSDLTATTTWQRFTYTLTSTTTSGFFAFNAASSGAAAEIHVWGAQLEQASTAGPYVPTTTAAATNVTTESLGLLVEEARTNSIRNNTMVGAVAGTPGTSPTNWGLSTTNAELSFAIAGVGTDSGISYVDIRAYGTVTASRDLDIRMESFTVIAAATGQTWTGSQYLKVANGSLANVSAIYLQSNTYTSASAYVTTPWFTAVTPTTADLVTQRYIAGATLSGATIAFIAPFIKIRTAASGAVDLTLRIGLPQLEQGAFATSVIPTSGTAATRSADVASITGTNFGTTRTNLLLRSEEFDSASWSKFQATVSSNTTTAPDSTANADSLIESAAAGTHVAFQNVTTSASATQSFSVYAKANQRSRLLLLVSDTGVNSISGFFNLSTGAVISTSNAGTGSGATASVLSVGNGWYRCILAGIPASSGATVRAHCYILDNSNNQSYTGDGTSGIYVWGAQLETGSTATDYIPTTTAAASAVTSSWYNASQQTIYSEAASSTGAAYSGYIYAIGSSFNDSIQHYRQLDFQPVARVRTASVDEYGATGNGAIWTRTSANRFVLALSNTSGRQAANGQLSSVTDDTSIAFPSVSSMSIGALTAGSSALNGTIRRLTYFPQRLPNTTLQAITQ